MEIGDIGSRALAETALKYSGLYRIYEHRLESQILKQSLPNHVAIILDGNRRWAKYHLLGIHSGHFMGADKAEELLTWIHDLGIKITTLYVLSNENLDRKDEEIYNIYNLLQIKLEKLYNDSRIHKRRMKIKAIGNVNLLPKSLQEILTRLAEDGKINIEDIDEKLIESCLYTSHLPQPEPDLILRTSGETRRSGFLIWQSAYSELVFMDVFWPEFRKIDLMRAIRTYQRRIRRFGK